MKDHSLQIANDQTQIEGLMKELQFQTQRCREIERKLNKIQRLHDTMAHNFPDGVIGVLNQEMRYVLIDGKELADMDLTTMSMTGEKRPADQHPRLPDETLNKLKKAFEGESASCEVNIHDKVYKVTAVPLTEKDQSVNEILCVIQNVTKEKRMEEGLVKALEKERELGELKSR
ncbi:MAG TPA: hypothetical protein VF490_20110, partial [Chryseosolibacter sp.]